ncbi:MAG: DNA polymerase III subunit [Planctomycetes bacterium]|nr:DNA polymerase III subunit [Planctomycetota bacterium]
MSDALFRPIGHDQVREWLGRVVTAQRANGAYLFTGPDGIGKSALALEFAGALRCQSPTNGWSCGACNECVRIARGVHPSVRSFAKPDDKSAFPVELVRDIVDEASKKRLEPGMRVFVIADADRFNDNSANAFLKTLEEPPADLIIVLLAENLAQVLPTIISRCQPVRFSPLSDHQVKQITAGWDQLPVNPDSREVLIRAAQGSPGRLRRMGEAGVLDTAREFLKSVRSDPFLASEKLIDSIQGGDDNEGKRAQLREIIALLTATLRDRLLGSLGAADLAPFTRPFPDEPFTADHLAATLITLDDLRERIDGNVNLKLCCDAIALAWPT